MKADIKWRVAPAPTGRYRSFERRGWPCAEWKNGKPAAAIHCADDYTPARARGEHPHAELVVSVADWSATTEDGRPTFKWKRCKQRASTLQEAKELARRVLEAHPLFWPKEAA